MLNCFHRKQSRGPLSEGGLVMNRYKERLHREFLRIFHETKGNLIEAGSENGKDYPAFHLIDEPVEGYASADDPLFLTFRNEAVIGPSFLLPSQWLEGARTVISFVMPFSEAVRAGNRSGTMPSREWLYARYEGQQFINAFAEGIKDFFLSNSVRAVVPSSDARFSVRHRFFEEEGRKTFQTESAWSERHAAYACGLGTFGISKGLITEKGTAVRFASIIIDQPVDADVRPYTRYDEYCIRCGACIPLCPAAAITLEHGKNNILCKEWVDKMGVLYAPRYGCGKCQTGVPCEHGIPGR